MSILRICVALGLVVSLACNRSSPATKAVAASVCSIAGNPESFDGRSVTVEAFLVSTGRDMVTLVDPACPGDALVLVPRKGTIDKSVSDLTAALIRGDRPPTTADRDVFGKFTGIFRVAQDRPRRRTFELITVSDVRITPKI